MSQFLFNINFGYALINRVLRSALVFGFLFSGVVDNPVAGQLAVVPSSSLVIPKFNFTAPSVTSPVTVVPTAPVVNSPSISVPNADGVVSSSSVKSEQSQGNRMSAVASQNLSILVGDDFSNAFNSLSPSEIKAAASYMEIILQSADVPKEIKSSIRLKLDSFQEK